MLSPLPRHSGWAHYFAHSPSRISLPRYGSRVGLCIVLFEACSAFTRVTACTLAPSPIRDALSEGFSHFVTSIAAPVASGWSVCRVGLAPTGKRRLSTAHARYRHLSTHHKESVRKLKEIDLIEMISEVDQKSKEWETQVLYFSAAWFAELRRQLVDRERTGPAARLFSYFQNRSWQTLARVRYNDDQLTDALTEWGGDSNAARCKAAYLLLRHSLQVLSQRRQCFGLADGTDPNLGPLGPLKEELLQVARLNPTILGPMYLHAGQVGFLSLSQLVPSAFEQSPEDSLENIFKIISRARDAAVKRNVAVPALDNLPARFSRLTFRVRTGRQRQRGRHGSVLTFKVDCSQPGGGTFPRRSVPIEAFYEPIFPAVNLPPSDSRFFRVAMKLDLRESINIPEY